MKSHHDEKRVCERVNLAKGKIGEEAIEQALDLIVKGGIAAHQPVFA